MQVLLETDCLRCCEFDSPETGRTGEGSRMEEGEQRQKVVEGGWEGGRGGGEREEKLQMVKEGNQCMRDGYR